MRLGKIGDKATNRAARKLHHQLKHAEPSVTMIGQVKAGKTSLVNAMVGQPDLLPADVNPWTSVVTALHLNPNASRRKRTAPASASSTWRNGAGFWTVAVGLVNLPAGRVPRMSWKRCANRSPEMREKSRKRLGDKFEMLMGQQHDYAFRR